MNDLYSDSADLYDAIHADVREDIPWVVRRAQQGGGNVLEPGCGSGRLLLPLAQAGLHVTGIDNAGEMVARARLAVASAGVADRVTLVEADMLALPAFGQPFAVVVLGYNTLMHVRTEQLRRLFHGVRRQLRPGGLLLIDTTNPLLLVDLDDQPEYEEERTFLHPASGEPVTQFSRFRCDSSAQTVNVAWRFHFADGTLRESGTLYHYHLPHQLQMAMAEAQLPWLQIAGAYDDSPFDEESERLLIVARGS